ncbi:hypothetical protein LZ575_04760 [Antarcticibacterium sp. 1MA-6-2]|uniref:hypothetical protein n=1 Tax=Antarcticibacterium sp. 1MA-6-2 TaxID=2908210 RepID=UPI001F24BA7F|nr:hypothetical protein [Antarcticibacterium sp. 1MA-6-2]UJH91953.1 hypothetical protein LZ575_04760 [Antarcticibacterium sp. 1MA-6-2]
MKKIVYSFIIIAFAYGCKENEENLSPAPLQTLPVVEVFETSAQTIVQYPATIEGIIDVELRPQVAVRRSRKFM